MDDPRGPGMHLVLAFWVAMLWSLPLVGCAGAVKIAEQVPTPVADMSVAETALPVAHDLAILAIDFSPPLECKEVWVEQEQVTLLVAVENRGLCQEEGARVCARLSDRYSLETLLSECTTLPVMAPTQVRVARFVGIWNVPYRPAYHLRVEVSPAKGERSVANNSRTYDLTINEPASEGDLASPPAGP